MQVRQCSSGRDRQPVRPLWAQAPFPSRGDGAVRPAGRVRAQRGRRRETPRRQAHVAARVVSGKTRRRSCPFGAPRTRRGEGRRRGGTGGSSRCLGRSFGVCRTFAQRRTTARSARGFSRLSRDEGGGLGAQGGRRPASLRLPSAARLGLGGRPQARGPPPDPCSSRAWTPAGRVKQVQDTQCGGKTRPDGDTGTLCVHRPP